MSQFSLTCWNRNIRNGLLVPCKDNVLRGEFSSTDGEEKEANLPIEK
jgi:hypothetical protein